MFKGTRIDWIDLTTITNWLDSAYKALIVRPSSPFLPTPPFSPSSLPSSVTLPTPLVPSYSFSYLYSDSEIKESTSCPITCSSSVCNGEQSSKKAMERDITPSDSLSSKGFFERSYSCLYSYVLPCCHTLSRFTRGSVLWGG